MFMFLEFSFLAIFFGGVREVEKFGDQVIAVEEKTFGAGRPANLPKEAGRKTKIDCAQPLE